MKKLQPTITYIKNNIETTVTINFWNQSKILRELLTITNEAGYIDRVDNPSLDKNITINKDIDFIHFKNFSIIGYFKRINCPKDTLCIFENCIFESKNSYSLTLGGGTFELIDPTFIKITRLKIKGGSDLNISYSSGNKSKISENITLESDYSGFDVTCENVTIVDHNNINRIDIKSKNISLNNNLDLDHLNLKGKNITIGNQEKPTIIKVWCNDYIRANKKLSLTNCSLENTDLYAPKIEIKDVVLTAEDEFKINENTYYQKPGESRVTVTDKDIASANLISILKGYQLELKKQIVEQIQEDLSSQFKDKEKLIEEKEQLLKIQQQELEQLKQETEHEKTKIEHQLLTKNLSKRPIKYYHN